MPRPRARWTSKRTCGFSGQSFSKVKEVVASSTSVQDCDGVVEVGLVATPGTSRTNTPSSSSSRRKLEGSFDGIECGEDNGNEIVSIELLSAALRSFVSCRECRGKKCIAVKTGLRKGLATKLKLFCENCSAELAFDSSEKRVIPAAGKGERYDVNTRFVYGLRTIGKGRTAGAALCAVMNLPQPIARFGEYNKFLGDVVEDVSNASMKKAADEAVQENDGNIDIAAAFDGSWQRRGHNSKNGVMTATSVDTGKVLDVSILTKHCRCETKQEDKHDVSCQANFKGASGSMEVTGASELFERSVEKRGVRYTQYLGDGDSKAFNSVVAEKPYGDVEITKLECVGHVQKRMGSRLRRLRKAKKGEKLSDGKLLTGRNRLTDNAVDLLQTYYGLAIRDNVDSIDNMKKAVWATYFHKLSTNEEPQHGLCDKKWCKYLQAKEKNTNYDHKGSLPKAVMDAIKPTYRDLSNPELLAKCLHGGTQNSNECFNSVIWARLPKTVFVEKITLTFGVHDAILAFNNGNIGRCQVISRLGMEPGRNMILAMRSFDEERIRCCEKSMSDFERKARQSRRNSKRRLEDIEDDVDDPAYGAGIA